MVVQGALRRHFFLANFTVVFEHAREVDRLAMVPHCNSADESFVTD